MKILIVSGFLGAGKTTFIKALVRRSGIRPVIMENEYGQNDLDAEELKQSLPEKKEIKILEFMEGCVCCTMKDSFVNSVMTIYCGLEPDYLVVEPTGVGRLGSILSNLKPLINDKISLLKPVVVLSPQTYSSNMAQYPSLYTDQIANAGIVVFSKAEQEDSSFLADAQAKIRKINPDAEIISCHYSLQSDDWWRSLMEVSTDNSGLPTHSEHSELSELSGTETFSRLSFSKASLHSPSELVVLLEDCLRGEFGRIARAKGVLPVGREMLRFDLADSRYAVTGAPEGKNRVVFIGNDLDVQALCRRMGTSPDQEDINLTVAQRRQETDRRAFSRLMPSIVPPSGSYQ